jgi:hypothetical protein|nr:MAG TPA: hypothetical protein [Caudoviricetes sp.]
MENKFQKTNAFVPQGKEKTRGENLRFLIYKLELSIRFWLKKEKTGAKNATVFNLYILNPL